MKHEARSASVDGDAAIYDLIRLGLVEMVWTDDGAAYRIVENLTGPNAALLERQRLRRS